MNINRIKQIETENKIWLIYLVIIGMSYFSNYYERDYFENHNLKSKEIYQKTNTIIFITLIIIYLYFEDDSIKSFKEKNKSQKKKLYDTLTLIASTAVLISGIIFLYVIIDDKNLDSEIAFN